MQVQNVKQIMVMRVAEDFHVLPTHKIFAAWIEANLSSHIAAHQDLISFAMKFINLIGADSADVAKHDSVQHRLQWLSPTY